MSTSVRYFKNNFTDYKSGPILQNKEKIILLIQNYVTNILEHTHPDVHQHIDNRGDIYCGNSGKFFNVIIDFTFT